MNYKDSNPRLSRWSLFLQLFQYDVMHRSCRANGNADTLSRIATNKFVAKGQGVWWTNVWLFRLFGVSISSYVFLFSYVPISLFNVTCMYVCIWVIANICMASRGQEQEVSEQSQESLDHMFFVCKN